MLYSNFAPNTQLFIYCLLAFDYSPANSLNSDTRILFNCIGQKLYMGDPTYEPINSQCRFLYLSHDF